MAFAALRRLTGSLTAVRETLESSVGLQKGLSPVAVDFGVSSLKLLQINATGETFNLVAGAMLETPEPLFHDHGRRLAFQLEHLPRLVRQGGFSGRRAVCSIPASQTFCKHLQLARLEGVSTAEAVKSTISGQLGCDPEALVYRHFEVKTVSQSGKVEVIGMAVGREMVQKLMAGLRKAKLELVGMHSEFAATLAAFDYLTRRADDHQSVVLYVDLGWSSTKITIAHGKDLVFARCVEMGGMHLDDAVASQLKIPAGQAHAVRLGLERLVPDAKAPAPAQTVGDLPVQPDLSEPLEIIRDEIAISMRYHEALFPGKKIERAVFVGGESRQRPLCQQLARALRIPAQVADPLARVARTGKEPMTGVDLREAQPAWSVPLGLCLSKTDL
jgi:type IV pilus assembly protein PilM